MRAIAQVPGPDLLETMNALIAPGLFSGLDTTAPAGLVPASFALVNNESASNPGPTPDLLPVEPSRSTP